jgi:hypothetical protein
MLSREKRNELIAACEQTYQAFAALDVAKDKKAPLVIDDAATTLNDFIVGKVKAFEAAEEPVDERIVTINIEGVNYKLHFEREANGKYLCKLINSEKEAVAASFKKMDDYSKQEKLDLMCAHTFVVEKDKRNNFVLGVNLEKEEPATTYQLGGANKIDLYRDHLSTLYKIHQRIKKGESISNILIALATGAGKTFVQAMWMMVLEMANMSGMFALPNKLLKQFMEDIAKLLPDNLVSKVNTLELKKPEENKKAKAAMDQLATGDQDETKFVVASFEELLDNEYDRVQQLLSTKEKTSQVAFSFDEQHLVMDQESRKLKLKNIAEHNLCMLLTATPSEETYKLCGKKPVARMSSHQKAKAGHGAFPTLSTKTDKTLEDKKMEIKMDFSFLQGLWWQIVSIFISQRSSPVISLMESLQYDDPSKYLQDETADLANYHQRRWGYQPPTSRKMLVISDNNEELVNLDNFVRKTDEQGDQLNFSVCILDTLRGNNGRGRHPTDQELDALKNSSDTIFFYLKDGEWNYIGKYSFFTAHPREVIKGFKDAAAIELISLLNLADRNGMDFAKQQKILSIMRKKGNEKILVGKVHEGKNVNSTTFGRGLVKIEESNEWYVVDYERNVSWKAELNPTQLQKLNELFQAVQVDEAGSTHQREMTDEEAAEVRRISNSIIIQQLYPMYDEVEPGVTMGIYRDGNVITRDSVYLFLQQRHQNLDKKIGEEFKKRKEEKQKEEQSAEAGGLQRYRLAKQLDNNIFSGMVEYLLSDLTGLDTITLNEMRKNNFAEIQGQIHNKLIAKLVGYQQSSEANGKHHLKDFFAACVAEYKEKLTYDPSDRKKEKGLDAAGAEQVAKLLAHILFGYPDLKLSEKAHFVENWTLENKARDKLFARDTAFARLFAEYATQHRVLYVMNGMQDAETPITEDQPFSGFDETRIKIQSSEGAHGKKPKNRDLTLIEKFDPDAEEHHYTPTYLAGVTETIADNYFKLGFTGMYVSNKKTEGFSDLNLHTVLSTLADSGDTNNDPSKRIQGAGRTRGKDPTQRPYFFTAKSKAAELAFDLERLNKPEDYYPAFFEAKRKYNRLALKPIGKRMAQDIERFMKEETDAYGRVEPTAYNRGIQLILLKAFREIYNNNNHDLKLAKKYFHRALRYANLELQRKVKRMKEPAKIKAPIRAVGTVLTTVHKFAHKKKTAEVRKKLQEKAKALRGTAYLTDQQARELLYVDIIEKVDPVVLQEKTIAFGEIKNLLLKKKDNIECNVLLLITQKLNPEEAKEANDTIKEYLLPLLVKFISPEKQAYCLEQANQYQNWHSILLFNRGLLEAFAKGSPDEQARIAIKLFRKVPSLAYFLDLKTDRFHFSPEFAADLMQPVVHSATQVIADGVLENLANYLSSDFLEHIKPLVIKKDFVLIESVLRSRENAAAFAKYLSEKRTDTSDPGKMLKLFITFCEEKNLGDVEAIKKIKTIQSRGSRTNRAIQKKVSVIQRDMSKNPRKVLTSDSDKFVANLLKPSEVAEFNQRFKEDLLPGLLLFLNDQSRAQVAEKLKTYEKWHELLFMYADDKEFQALTKLDISDPTNGAKIADLCIRLFNDTQLVKLTPEAKRDYKATCEEAGKTINEHLSKLTSVGNLMANPGAVVAGIGAALGGLFSKNPTVNVAQGVGSQLLGRYLAGDFLKDIEPLYYPSDLQTFRDILSNKDTSVDLANFLIAKKQTASQGGSDIAFKPENMFDYVKEFFSTYQEGKHKDAINHIRTAPDRLLEGTEYLKGKSEDYKKDLEQADGEALQFFTARPQEKHEFFNTFNPVYKDSLKRTMLGKFLPLILCCVKEEDGQHERIMQACQGYDGWLGLLEKHKKTLSKLDKVKIENLNSLDAVPKAYFALLNDIPGLEGLTVAADSRSVKSAIENLRTSFKGLGEMQPPLSDAAIANLAAVFRDNLDKFRHVMFENDWVIFQAILMEDGNAVRFARRLTTVVGEARANGNENLGLETLGAVFTQTFSAHPRFSQLHTDQNGNVTFIDQMKKMSGDALDTLSIFFAGLYKAATNEEKVETFREEITSMISLDSFRKTILDSVSCLSDANIETMLKLLGKPECKDDLLRLVALLKDKDYDSIFDEFFKDDLLKLLDGMIDVMADSKKPMPDFSKGKFFVLFGLIVRMGLEQIHCHEYFNHALEERNSPKPELVKTLGEQNEFISLLPPYECKEHFLPLVISSTESALPLNAELSAATTKRTSDLLSLTANNIVSPLMESISKAVEVSVLPTTAKTANFAQMRESAIALGERINQLTGMTSADVTSGSRFVDAIDTLIEPILGRTETSRLATWWLNRMKRVSGHRGFARFQEVKDLDHFVTYCDVTSNVNLMKGYVMATKFLANGKNEIFSDHYGDVHQLRRQIYVHMTLNTAQEVMKTEPDFYKEIIDDVKQYLWKTTGMVGAYDEGQLKAYAFNSTTFQKMRNIAFNDKLSDVDKLVRIQFLARDFRKDPLHNLHRKVSHFFSRKKTEEGVLVREFCTMLGKSVLHDADNTNLAGTRHFFKSWINKQATAPVPQPPPPVAQPGL